MIATNVETGPGVQQVIADRIIRPIDPFGERKGTIEEQVTADQAEMTKFAVERSLEPASINRMADLFDRIRDIASAK